MISSSIVSYQTTGTKSIGQMVLLPNLDTGTQLSFAVTTYTFLEELTPISRDLMMCINLTLIKGNGQKLIVLVNHLSQELSIDPSSSAMSCTLLVALTARD
jgi:hypothetical protein